MSTSNDSGTFMSFQSVKRVIGVEIIENAVEDAKANAQLNGGSYFLRSHFVTSVVVDGYASDIAFFDNPFGFLQE